MISQSTPFAASSSYLLFARTAELAVSSAVRAKRRYDELTAKGVDCNIKEIEQDIIERDYRDMHRETSPLKQAEDAVLLDSSDLDIDGVVAAMKKIIKEA